MSDTAEISKLITGRTGEWEVVLGLVVEGAVAEGRAEGLTFTAVDFPARLEDAGDLFQPVLTSEQQLPGSG